MIEGLKKEFVCKYKDKDGEEYFLVIGTDEDNDFGYAYGRELESISSEDLEYITKFYDFFNLKDKFMYLPEDQRKTIVEDVMRIFSEEIEASLQSAIKNSS